MSSVDPPAEPAAPADSDPVLDRWLFDHEALGARIRAGSRDFQDGLEGLSAAYALIRAESLGAAILDRHGRILATTANFADGLGALHDRGLIDPVLLSRGLAVQLIDPRSDGVRTGVVVTPVSAAGGLHLPPHILAAAREPRAAFIILSATPGSVGDSFVQACRAFQLTPGQTRVARSLLLTGSVRAAARDLGIAYDTAREAVSEAMLKVGVKKLAALTDRLTRLSFGVWPTGPVGEAVLLDSWGLSPRQANLALRVVEGMSRDEAAAAMGLSTATMKTELKVVFQVMGVRSSSGLARAIMEAQILSLLTDATKGAIVISGEGPDPLTLTPRADGTLVAFSDYGPPTGDPVFVLHMSLACRSVPRRLLQALQAAGFRPIALDRPGYGLTEMPGEPAPDLTRPFDLAVDDMQMVADLLKLERINVLGRGAAQVALAAQARMPERLARVVLINPDPPTDGAGRYRGPAAAVAEAFHRHPAVIEKLIGAYIHWLGKGLGRRILERIIGDCASDRLAMADPKNFADYERGFRPFITGRMQGLVAELSALTRWSSAPVEGISHWRLLQGAQDFMTSPLDVSAYWRGVLPGAEFRTVSDAGRLLAFSHPGLIAATLRSATGPALER